MSKRKINKQHSKPKKVACSDVKISDIMNIVAKKMNGEISKEEYETVGRFYALQAPSKLYRYRSDEKYAREINAIQNNCMWFASLPTLNDPFESYSICNLVSIADDLIANDKDIRGASFSQKRLLIGLLSKEMDENNPLVNMAEELTVACMSENNDSALMWGHYANGHRGICIEYNTMDLSRHNSKTFIPVNYTTSIPELREIGDFYISRFFLDLVRTKAKDWSYESEWRCIQDKSACGDKWNPNGALLDVVPATAIYLGCRSSNVLVNECTTLCEELKIPLYKMEQSKTEYRLIPKRLL